MSVREIQARTLLARTKDPERWFGVRYNMNIYRGCEHHCIYCDSRSDCYRIPDFDGELLVKANAITLLRRELSRFRVKGVVGTGAMQDPYTPSEATLNMTGRALEVIAECDYPVHLTTKSDLVLRDTDLLARINRQHASVCFTVTTADDGLARKLEPGAPAPSRRFAAARALAERGIQVGVLIMPILPFINDTEENLTAVIEGCAANGVQFVVPWFGVTLRTGQREWFYRKLDVLYPGLRARYERTFGDRYRCDCPDADGLYRLCARLMQRYGLERSVRPWVEKGTLPLLEAPPGLPTS
jgi:DNA repair photolyase